MEVVIDDSQNLGGDNAESLFAETVPDPAPGADESKPVKTSGKRGAGAAEGSKQKKKKTVVADPSEDNDEDGQLMPLPGEDTAAPAENEAADLAALEGDEEETPPTESEEDGEEEEDEEVLPPAKKPKTSAKPAAKAGAPKAAPIAPKSKPTAAKSAAKAPKAAQVAPQPKPTAAKSAAKSKATLVAPKSKQTAAKSAAKQKTAAAKTKAGGKPKAKSRRQLLEELLAEEPREETDETEIAEAAETKARYIVFTSLAVYSGHRRYRIGFKNENIVSLVLKRLCAPHSRYITQPEYRNSKPQYRYTSKPSVECVIRPQSI